jgi:hypothetical protein
MHYLFKGMALLGLFILPARLIVAADEKALPLAVLFGANQLQGETGIAQLAVGHDGQVIAAGERVGFYHDGSWEFLPQPHTGGVRRLLVDGDTLWVSSFNEIGRLKLPLHTQSRYEKLELPAMADAGDVWYLARQGDTLIATTREDVWFIDLTRNTSKRVNLPNTSRLFLHSLNGKLIVTGRGIAPQEIRLGNLLPLESPLPDKTDQIWFGTTPSLIVARDIYEKQGAHYQSIMRLKSDSDLFLYTSVAKWGELLAITTYNKGLILVAPRTASYRVISQTSTLPSLGAIHSVADSSGRLWVGTTQGVSLLESFRFGSILPTKEFPVSAFRSDGLLINYEDRGEFRPESGLPERRPRAFAVVPTTHGLAIGYWGKFSVGAKEFQAPGSSVEVIAEIPNGRILATSGERFYEADYAS